MLLPTEGRRPVLKICGLTRVADMRCAEAAGADFCGLIVEIERSPRCISRAQAALLARTCRVRPVLVVESMPPEEIAALVDAVRAGAPALRKGEEPRVPQEVAVQLHGGDADYVRQVAEAVAQSFGGAELHSRPLHRAALQPSRPSVDAAVSGASQGQRDAKPSRESAGGNIMPPLQTAGHTVEIWRPIGLPERTDDREALVERTLAQIEAALDAGATAIVLDTRTGDGTGGSGRTCDWQAAAEIIRRTNAPVILAGGLGPENLREALEATGAAGVDLSSSLEAAPGRKAPLRLRELARVWRELPR